MEEKKPFDLMNYALAVLALLAILAGILLIKLRLSQ